MTSKILISELRFAIIAVALVVAITGCSSANSLVLSSPSSNAAELPLRCTTVDIARFGDKVSSSWTTAPTDAVITPPLASVTVRQFLTPHLQGDVMRLRLSNRYSQVPVTIESLHVAFQHADEGGALVSGSECGLTVNGDGRITIPAGESITTDAIVFPVKPSQTLGVSFYAPEPILQLTRHMDAVEVPYFSIVGDHARNPSAEAFVTVPTSLSNNFLILEALEVAAAQSIRTVVAVGDSITDGSGNLAFTVAGLTGSNPAIGQDQRYPDFLARGLLDVNFPASVVNKGISGNKLLSAGTVPQFGPSLISRFDDDVLATAGITHVLLMIGTNDFGVGMAPKPQAVIDGYVELIGRAHDAGVKIILGTITPAKGAISGELPLALSESFGIMHGSPQAVAAREEVNNWIRTQTLSDGVVDFYACLDDPENPGYLRPDFNSGDNLHPNAAGYAAMAACVDIELFR